MRIGNVLAVAGTAPIESDGATSHPGDVYGQTKRCIEIMKRAMEEAGATLDDVIRTRIMLTDISQWKEAAKAHGEFFSDIRPACTFVEVKGFIKKEWLVETEADCVLQLYRSPYPSFRFRTANTDRIETTPASTLQMVL